MIEFSVPQLTNALVGLEENAKALSTGNPKYARDLAVWIKEAGEVLCSLPISPSLSSQFERLSDYVAGDSSVPFGMVNAQTTVVLVGEFYSNLMTELIQCAFLAVPPNKKQLLIQREPPFGDTVAEKFPETERDIAAAARCLALDESTACVFHCMRIIGEGLKAFARVVGVEMTPSLEAGSWGGVIKKIEDALPLAEKEARSDERNAKIQAWYEAASQFRYFKGAWRNHVNHSLVSYDEREAQTVYDHTRDFMLTLVASVL